MRWLVVLQVINRPSDIYILIKIYIISIPFCILRNVVTVFHSSNLNYRGLKCVKNLNQNII